MYSKRFTKLLFGIVAILISTSATVLAQFKDGEPGGGKLGESRVQEWQAGVEVEAASGTCMNIVAYIPVPVEWPEQIVRVDEEDFSPGTQVKYQKVDGTARVMVVRIRRLLVGQKAKAVATFEIERRAQLPPEDTSIYQLPERTKLDYALRKYLSNSPGIETRDAKIRAKAREIVDGKEGAWERVEAIYDWTRDNVEFKKGSRRGAAVALKRGRGDHEDLTSLFIALCRAAEIPARTVWVPHHCYAEFYLLDGEGTGHWFPCEVAGTRAFGEMSALRPILEKGDNFRPPWDRRDVQRYLREDLTGAGGRPRVKFIREMVAD